MDSAVKWAYVKYRRDDFCAKVPENFIDYDIRNKRVKPGTMYWVFWSQTEGDSPAQMLKRRAIDEIPHVENDEETEEAAYYRATISVIKDSPDELDEWLKKHRVKEVPAQLLQFPSFDMSSSSQNSNQESNSKQQLKNKQLSNSKQRQSRNSKQQPHSRVRDTRRSKGETQSSTLTAKRTANLSLNESLKESLQLVRDSTSVPDANASSPAPPANERTPLRQTSASKTALKRNFDWDSSESSADADDPPIISPRKFQKVVEKLEQAQSEVEHVRAMNLKLQDRLLAALADKANCSCKQKAPAPHPPGSFMISKVQPSSAPVVTPPSQSLKTSQQSLNESQSSICLAFSDPSSPQDSSFELASVSAPSDDTFSPDDFLLESYADRAPNQRCTPTAPSIVIEAQKLLCSTAAADDTTVKKPSDTASNIPWKWPHLPQSSVLMPARTIPRERLASDFWPLEKGKRGDQLFCKNAASWLFTDELIATKLVVGINTGKAKGEKKKKNASDSTDVPKPWTSDDPNLNPAGLRAIRNFLIFRVKMENEEIIGNDRVKQSTVNYYIQQKKKSLRAAGYGNKKPSQIEMNSSISKD